MSPSRDAGVEDIFHNCTYSTCSNLTAKKGRLIALPSPWISVRPLFAEKTGEALLPQVNVEFSYVNR